MSRVTERERQVLQLIAQGRSTKQIAGDLNISMKTAVTHRHNLLRKMEAQNTANLVMRAIQLGELEVEIEGNRQEPNGAPEGDSA